jgi:HPr kinase/phosphorylase
MARRRGQATAGFFNPVHPWTTQVLGEAGLAYLATLKPAARKALARTLGAAGMKTLVAARGIAIPDRSTWRAAGIACETRDAPAHEIVLALREQLAGSDALREVAHGVLMEVHGVGVLVEGAAGAGKSLLALDLISRGHALIADDAIELVRPAPGILLGRCPEVLEGYLASRDLGVVDVLRMHGSRALRKQCRMDLVVKLVRGRRAPDASQVLSGQRSTRQLLGEKIPALSLPAQTGHNLAALVEAACLDRRLRLDGIEADVALSRRQARAIERKK